MGPAGRTKDNSDSIPKGPLTPPSQQPRLASSSTKLSGGKSPPWSGSESHQRSGQRRGRMERDGLAQAPARQASTRPPRCGSTSLPRATAPPRGGGTGRGRRERDLKKRRHQDRRPGDLFEKKMTREAHERDKVEDGTYEGDEDGVEGARGDEEERSQAARCRRTRELLRSDRTK